MSIDEQQELKKQYYDEAVRYINNARENLKNAKKEGNVYCDRKYVRAACGIAYSGVLAYQILHLYGYNDGLDNVKVVNEGLSLAESIIEKIKPLSP